MPEVRSRIPKVNYPSILDEAWRQAIAPREKDAPTVISTFAGGGGSSLGYHMAGFRELLAVEWDDNAAQTLRLNLPHLDIHHGDIAKLAVSEVLQRTGLEPGQLDVFDGSPPCQGFSTAGKRNIDDERNQLFREYVRLLRGLRPKVFVMENVSGMVKGKMKLMFAEILRELKASGYKVSARLLNAKYFYVPQSRERMIFIGVRGDLGVEPSHPKAESVPIVLRDALREVVQDDEQRELPEFLRIYGRLHRGGWSTEVDKYRLIKGVAAGAISTKWASWRTVCGTLPKSEISSTGIVHPDRERYISASEAKRIGAFPDNYIFTDRAKAIERIGNSVPPLFMRSIARHIRAEMLGRMEQ